MGTFRFAWYGVLALGLAACNDPLVVTNLNQPDRGTEIRGRRVKVVAITDGIRSFTTTPYIFVDLKSARTYTGTPPDRANNLLVRLNNGADRENVLQALRAQSQT